MKTKNIYAFPVVIKYIERVSFDESDVHVGPLKHSVDFIVPEGTPVKAALGGTVVDVKNRYNIGGNDRRLEKYGNFVEIKHDNEEYSEYEHLAKDILVGKGQKVRKGQIIGYSGATGYLAKLGPHLHFMVGVYGKNIKQYQTLEIRFRK
ncbi:M23 family metallopeptidase [archaeon]|nr:M23 family metallopeptidase [archaeon]